MSSLHAIYHPSVPSYLDQFLALSSMQRLQDIGMNCGVEYTSLPFFKDLPKSSRYDHSLGVTLITAHFGGRKEAVLAGLFHDIATPCFAHVVDFLKNDHETQTSTEKATEELLKNDPKLLELLSLEGVSFEAIKDYSAYPLCDNPSPKLSADRLEYTLRNLLYFGFANKETIAKLYNDLVFAENESGEQELQFKHRETALTFANLTLKTSKVYVSDPDRFAMEDLAFVLKRAIERKNIKEEDLMETEPKLVQKLLSSEDSASDWLTFRSLSDVKRVAETIDHSYIIRPKLRYIDPYVQGLGRLSQLDSSFKKNLQDYLESDFSYRLGGVYSSR